MMKRGVRVEQEINAIIFGVDGFLFVLVIVASVLWVGRRNTKRFGLRRWRKKRSLLIW